MKDMRILVTGANGFVGKALCERLPAVGWQVRGSVSSEQAALFLPVGVEAVRMAPLGPGTDWSGALKDVDAVAHLAARVHMMKDAAGDPLAEFRRVNTAGTERLAETAAAAGVRRFVYVSSIKVNGEEAGSAYTEDDTPAPQDPYGISKWEAEQALRQAADKTGMQFVVVRPPLVYGPGVRANFFSLLRLADRGIPLPLGSVRNARSLIGLGNLVDAIAACLTHPAAAGQTYLVSDGDDVSTPELVRRMAAALGKEARLMPFPAGLLGLGGLLSGKSAAVNRLLGSLTVDIKKIREELGWKPPKTMAQELKETVQWYRRGRSS